MATQLSDLIQALYRGDGERAQELRSQRDDLDLFEAAAVGDVPRIHALLAAGQDVNAWSADGFTALHLAAFFGGPDAVRELASAGAGLETAALNQQFAEGAHPLHSAAAAQNLGTVRALLEVGADPNAVQHGGFTPLLEAAQSGNTVLAELLLAHGADPRIALADGTTASKLARKGGHADLAARLEGLR